MPDKAPLLRWSGRNSNVGRRRRSSHILRLSRGAHSPVAVVVMRHDAHHDVNTSRGRTRALSSTTRAHQRQPRTAARSRGDRS